MFLNSLHYCLLNKPMLFTCATFENGSDFLTAPWESVAGLQQNSKNLLPFFLVCSIFSSSSVAVLFTAILSLFLIFCHLYTVNRLTGFIFIDFYFTCHNSRILFGKSYPSFKESHLLLQPFPKH